MFQFFKARRVEKETAFRLYRDLVKQARLAPFYNEYSVADTVEGRLDMILLHLFLVENRLAEEGDAFKGLRRFLQEAMVSDLDRSLREMGVGDMSVGKEMKKVGAAWLGRLSAYGVAFESDSPESALENTLLKNLYADDKEAPVALMADYVRKAHHLLSLTEVRSVLECEFIFPEPISENVRAVS